MRFAKATGRHVYRWPVQIQNWEQKPASDHVPDAMKEPCMYEYFVQGADGFITANISKPMRMVNGSRVRYHSIVPACNEQANCIKAMQKTVPGGGIIDLQEPPFAINVELVDELERKDVNPVIMWKDYTLVDDSVVVPIQHGSFRTKWDKTILPGGDRYLPSCLETSTVFPLELGFAIMVHKAQGCTLPCMIIALSSHHGKAEMTYASLYVDFSRSENGKRHTALVERSCRRGRH